MSLKRHFSCVDQLGNELVVQFPPMRIISLVPSQTELLADLGLQNEVVGITKFCIHPPGWQSKKKIGGTKNFNFEVIEQLKPDLIIGNKEENYRTGIETLQQKYPVWMSDITTLSDAVAMIKALGALTDRSQAAEDIANRIEKGFASVRQFEFQRVLYLIWKKPWMAAGPNTFIHHMLSAIGLKNVVTGPRYPEVQDSEFEKLDPEIILLSSEPYPFKESHIDELSKLCPNAKILLVDGEMFSWYGSRLLKAPAYFDRLSL